MTDHPRVQPPRYPGADPFGLALLSGLIFTLASTTIFMPKTYVPDRWMIAGWGCFVTSLGLTLGAHFAAEGRWRRLRMILHAVAAVALVVGFVATVIFVSEGEPDDAGEDNYARLKFPRD